MSKSAFRPRRVIFLVCLPALLAVSCVTTPKSTDSRAFKNRYGDSFRYCSVEAVRQSEQRSCGAAALVGVMNYWKAEGAPDLKEKDIVRQYPAASKEGYPLLQLREIALRERFAAFAVSMDGDPWNKLGEHLDNGRPVICAVQLPRGRYWGSSLPLVETLDRRTVMSTGNEWKSHYVVAMGRNYKEIILMDPKYGIVKLPRESFVEFWRLEGYAALICSSI
ncbi:MAG: C39 family peptidase [Verrucomicrobiae bacterium]|nr:C39 family peptidase [Verrucomicrobiae bacterium]MCP5539132.1 C39 family peptidase [Akkermansiaceae bacterium]MCP5549783.1 C39 family peptidase [Akkermansiaceae bacterium]